MSLSFQLSKTSIIYLFSFLWKNGLNHRYGVHLSISHKFVFFLFLFFYLAPLPPFQNGMCFELVNLAV